MSQSAPQTWNPQTGFGVDPSVTVSSGGSHVGDPSYGHYVTNHAGGRFWVGNDGSSTPVGGDPSYGGGASALASVGQELGLSADEMAFMSLASAPAGVGQGIADAMRAIWERHDRLAMFGLREKMYSLREAQMSHQEAMDMWRQTMGNKQLSDREAVSAWNEKIGQSRLDFLSHEASIRDPYTQEQMSLGQYKLAELAKRSGMYGGSYRQMAPIEMQSRLYSGQ